MGDPILATAILDRLLHHSHVVNIRGNKQLSLERKNADGNLRNTPNNEIVHRRGGSILNRRMWVNYIPALTQNHVIEFMYMQNRALNLKEISTGLNIAKQQLTNIIKKLEASEYLIKAPDPRIDVPFWFL